MKQKNILSIILLIIGAFLPEIVERIMGIWRWDGYPEYFIIVKYALNCICWLGCILGLFWLIQKKGSKINVGVTNYI